MLPFGRCLLLWRLQRGMSQAALAQKAGIPQPNLSDMERGERDVSLRTLRTLAHALGVKPGVLADGTGPQEFQVPSFSRQQLENIAQAAVEGYPLADPVEDRLARSLRYLTRDRRNALQGPAGDRKPLDLARGRRAAGGRKAQREWLALTGNYPAPVLNSLIERIAEKSSSARALGGDAK